MIPVNKRLAVRSPIAVPGHAMFGDWALPGREYSYISTSDLVRALGPGRTPRSIVHSEICAKPGTWFGINDFIGTRYEKADPKFPGLLVAGMPNPCQLPYRMIDGRRRLEKLQRRDITQSLFYVFDFSEVLPYIFDFDVVP